MRAAGVIAEPSVAAVVMATVGVAAPPGDCAAAGVNGGGVAGGVPAAGTAPVSGFCTVSTLNDFDKRQTT